MDILIVEDDWLIAYELELELIRAGLRVVGAVPSMHAALRSVETKTPDIALVDVLLGPQPDGLRVASKFAERGIPVILITGSSSLVPHHLSGAVGLIDKPCPTDGLLASIAFVTKAASIGALHSERPSCLRLAPAPDASDTTSCGDFISFRRNGPVYAPS